MLLERLAAKLNTQYLPMRARIKRNIKFASGRHDPGTPRFIHRCPGIGGPNEASQALELPIRCETRFSSCREFLVEGRQIDSSHVWRKNNLAVVHVPSVPHPSTELFHSLAASISAAQEREGTVSWAQRITLFRSLTTRDPLATQQLDMHSFTMAPMSPLAYLRCMLVNQPLKRRERIAQVEVQQDSCVLYTAGGLLKAPPQMDQGISAARQGDPALPMREKQALEMLALIGSHSLGNESAP